MELSSAAEFVRLRSSQDPHDYGAADRGTASVAVWREVLADYPDFRRWVAHNKTVPLEILETLAGDTDLRVRAAVASQQRLSLPLFNELAADEVDAVRLRIVHNAATPRVVLERLTHDPYDLVSARARVRLGGIAGRADHAELQHDAEPAAVGSAWELEAQRPARRSNRKVVGAETHASLLCNRFLVRYSPGP